MTDYDPRDQDQETPVLSGPAPAPEVENPLVPLSLAATLTKAEIDQQVEIAIAHPRSPSKARDAMIGLATMDDRMAEECIYSVPRGGKQIRGESIRFAEIVFGCWPNSRCAARVTHEDQIGRFVEAEAMFHDLETNRVYVARARRRIELKKGRKTVDPDMIQLAGAAAISVARRNAILGGVPKPVWRRASEAVQAVIRGDQKTLAERRDGAISYFNKMGVPNERVLKALEVKHVDDITLDHLIDLNGMRAALKGGETTLDQLFPEQKPDGPKPETLEDKLKVLETVNPETGEIGVRAPIGVLEEAVKQAAPAEPPKSQRGPRGARKPSAMERLQAEGDAAVAKGEAAFREWESLLTNDDVANISPAMDRRWQEMLKTSHEA